MLIIKKNLACLLCLTFLGLIFPLTVIADTAAEFYKKGEAAARNQDWAKAEREYKRAASQGHLHAQKALALMYLCYNDEEAVKWLRLAAKQQDSDAQLALADLLVDGGCEATVRSYEEAVQWYRMAAKSKNVTHQAEACAGIAQMYEYGLGVSQDFVSAHMWYDLAAQIAGNGTVWQGTTGEKIDVVLARDRLARKLSSEQIGRSRQMQKEWKGLNSN